MSKKTAEFQNALANRKYGADKDVASKMLSTNKRNMPTAKVVYETITMPIPTWVKVMYQISIRTEYQQQMNELIRPFITVPGNSRTPKRIEAEGHYYEVFIDGGFSNNSNQKLQNNKWYFLFRLHTLDGRWVEHDAHATAKRLWRKV